MELKTLILGLVFSVGIFAVKSGAGLAYILKREDRILRQVLVMAGFAVCYSLLFAGAWLLILRFDFLAHLDAVMMLFKNGMALHFLLAGLLVLWGGYLLGQDASCQHQSHGWMVLSIPCPVCFGVILFSGSFLHGMRPDEPYLFVGLAALFIGVAMVTAVLLALSKKTGANYGLGGVMLCAGLYFLLSLIVVPQFADFERMYRISLGSKDVALAHLPLLLVGLGLLFTLGFFRSFGRWAWKSSLS